MSGRLVILPHKSWNVWNQDNREKVARDERLHREAEEAKAEKAKLLLQEQNLELLQSEQGVGLPSNGSSSEVHGDVAPFRLFEDLERLNSNMVGNAEYLKEKALKEQIQKKKDGIADWALGEGSYENSKTRPWYAVLQSDTTSDSSTIVKQEPGTASASQKIVREITRKERADPMGNLLHINQPDYQPKNTTGHGRIAETSLDRNESKEPEPSVSEADSGSERKKHKKKRHQREERNDERKSEYKRSKHHHTDRIRERSEAIYTRDHGGGDSHSERPAAAVDNLAALRQKRLEREAVEKKRAALLLASVDIYGAGNSGFGGGGREYSQQYNPHLARAYKR